MNAQESTTKKRRPLLAAVLSFLAPGLGQVYNGELRKGILLSLGLSLAALLYAFRIYTDGSLDTPLFWAMAAICMLVEVYSKE